MKRIGSTPQLNGQLPEEGLLRLPDVRALYPVGKTTWYEGIKRGTYPPPVRIGRKASAWRVEHIRELIDHGPKPDGHKWL